MNTFLLSYWLTASVLLHLAHTVEETQGLIWIDFKIPPELYFTFQLIVGLVACIGFYHLDPVFLWALIGLRVGDVLFTHIVLGFVGKWTAPLLLIDAAVAFFVFLPVAVPWN